MTKATIAAAVATGGVVASVMTFFWNQDRAALNRTIEGLRPKVESLSRLLDEKEAEIGALKISLADRNRELGRMINLDDFKKTGSPPPSCDGSPVPQSVATTDGEGLYNLALLSTAKAWASSELPNFPDRHRIDFLNDGWYNNCRSWIAATPTAEAGINLGNDFMVHSIELGSEHSKHWSDRAPTGVRVFAASGPLAEGNYREVAAVPAAIHGTQKLKFAEPVRARFLKITIDGATPSAEPRIDEIGVYGLPVVADDPA